MFFVVVFLFFFSCFFVLFFCCCFFFVVVFSKSNYMCKLLICHDMLHSECLLLLNINFVNSGKECKKAIIFLMNLLNYIEEENFDKNNENLKYLNDISGNLLQILEGKDATSNLETNVKLFMSETVRQYFFAENGNNLYEMIRRKPPVKRADSAWYIDFPGVNEMETSFSKFDACMVRRQNGS